MSSKDDESLLPKSRRRTKCGHCLVPIRRYRLTEHTKRVHPRKPVKDDADKTQSVLNIGMFQHGKLPVGKDVGASTSTSHEASDTESRKRKHGSEEDVGHEEPGPSKKAKLNDGDEIDVNDEAMDVTDQDGGEVEISQIETTSSEKMDNLPISRPSTATEMSEKEIEKPSTDEKLDTILATLSQLKLNCENAQKMSSEPEKADIKSNEESDIEAVKVLIQSCKSISRLCDLANLILSEDGHVSCVVCTTTDRHIGQGQGHGVFKYDFSLGVDFTTENQPLAFTNLKKSVARHLSTQTHKNNLLKADEDATFARKQNILNQSVGLTLGKQAYRILKYGRPFKDFEVDMVLLSDAKVKKKKVKDVASNMVESMIKNMNNRFPNSFFEEIENKEKSASIMPIVSRAQTSSNESELMSSSEVQTFLQKHPAQVENARNLCMNIFRQRVSLGNCETDIQIYHKLYSCSDLYVGAEHILSTLAKIMCSSPPESIVESMGSVVESIRQVRGGSKSSTNRQDVEDLSQELSIHWNGPHISHCSSIVKQALNIHFKGRSWHFNATDVRSRLHKVSTVVDRLNRTTPKLSFMTK